MKIKRFRGNITFLALFVLLASALIGVLVGLFMKNFLRYSEDITTYERTSYLAKAGTELWLAIVNSRNPGLEYTLESGSDLMNNFSCPYEKKEGELCTHQPAFSLSLSWLANSFENCSEENLTKVWPWLSVIIPLFKDIGLNTTAEGLQRGNISALEGSFGGNFKAEDWKIWLLKFNPEENTLNLQMLNSLQDIRNSNEESYLVVANPNLTEQKLCISNPNGIPQESVKIISIWYFKDKQLWTETIAKKALPDFLKGDNYLWGKKDGQ